MSCVVLGKFPKLHSIYLSSNGMLMVPHRTVVRWCKMNSVLPGRHLTLPKGQKYTHIYACRKTKDSPLSFPCQIRYALYGTNPKAQQQVGLLRKVTCLVTTFSFSGPSTKQFGSLAIKDLPAFSSCMPQLAGICTCLLFPVNRKRVWYDLKYFCVQGNWEAPFWVYPQAALAVPSSSLSRAVHRRMMGLNLPHRCLGNTFGRSRVYANQASTSFPRICMGTCSLGLKVGEEEKREDCWGDFH